MKKFLALACLGLAAGAFADPVKLVFKESGPLGQYDIKLNGDKRNNVRAGWLKYGFSNMPDGFTLCTEITQSVGPRGDSIKYHETIKNGQIGYLLNKYNALAAGNGGTPPAAEAVGLQLAVWELTYDGDGSMDLGGGNFRIRDADNQLGEQGLILAQQYLNESKGKAADYFSYANGHYQNQVKAVPEPATFAGAGLLALALLRRRKKKNA